VDYELQYDPKHRILLIVMGRTVTEASALAAYDAVHGFVAAEGPCSTIADLSLIESVKVTGYFIRCLALMPPAIAAGQQLILVAPGTLVYGLSRMFHLWRGETAAHEIVRSLGEAYASLGLEMPDFRAVDNSPRLAAAVMKA
jgi:hypothetical protein